ncbi:conserved oligomeric Golgi complex subunit [Achlya hypogyna]|uniref:Conserved oligomeric Golgi complex subunit 2 n=1 Tax=Achlya hypogyna TaxID=1202772 RepID=A0A1V9Z6V8_ACHHY|nr:conserved oligomeric Golgi complex subunit [Achlya hypogyna]
MYCFREAAFEGETFSPIEFLEECQGRNPIAAVHRDLEAFKRSLENQLVAIIDKDYAEFLQLSTKLRGVNTAVSSLRDPLVQILDRVLAVQAAAEAMVGRADKQVENIRGLERNKAELALTITLCEKLDLVETLLQITTPNAPNNTNGDTSESEPDEDEVFISVHGDEQAVLLERVAKLTVELQHQIAQGADVPSVQAEESRMTEIEHTLREKLEVPAQSLPMTFYFNLQAEFATEIVPDSFYTREHVINVKNVNHLLRSFVALQEPSVPENMVARLLVQPFLDTVITRARLDGRSRGSCEGLTGIYSAIVDFVAKKLSAVLKLTVCQEKKNGVDLLGRGVWAPILATLEDKLSEIFVAYNPDRIYHNYAASMAFLQELEGFCASDTAQERFRATAAVFRTKWDMDVYFQLRQSELSQALNSAFGKRPTETALLADVIDGYLFPVAKQLELATLKCFADGVHLEAQTPKFVRLCLTLLSDFVAYWATPLAAARDLAAAKVPALFPQVNHSCIASGEDVFAVANDLHRVANHVTTALSAALCARLAHAMPTDEASVVAKDLLDDSLRSLRDLEATCWSIAASVVAEDCMKVLPAVRTIKGQYQMTNKPAPSTHSPYVPTIVKPLETFLAKWGAPLRGDSAFAQRVLFETCAAYASLALELLKSAAELEESLKSRKLQRMSAVATPDGLSDTDKMRLQIELDLQELARLARVLSVDMTPCEAFAMMQREVAT